MDSTNNGPTWPSVQDPGADQVPAWGLYHAMLLAVARLAVSNEPPTRIPPVASMAISVNVAFVPEPSADQVSVFGL